MFVDRSSRFGGHFWKPFDMIEKNGSAFFVIYSMNCRDCAAL